MREMKDFFGDDNWYKEGNFWRRKNSDGSNGKGDLIYNTCGKILYDQDHSQWAKDAFLACWILLWQRKRWPDDMGHYMDASSWFGRIVNMAINKVIKTNLPYRAQKRMSRDPFVTVYAVAAMYGRYNVINCLSMPLYIYRPKSDMWRKYLRYGHPLYLELYRFFSKFSSTKHEYVRRLNQGREIAIEYKKESFLKLVA